MPLYQLSSTLGWALVWEPAVGTNALSGTNVADGVTDTASSCRAVRDLRNVNTVQLSATVATTGGANVRFGMQYSIDSGSTWVWLDGTDGATDSSAAVTAQTLSTNGAGVKGPTADIVLHAAAKTATTQLRCVFVDGNGSTSPAVRCVALIATGL